MAANGSSNGNGSHAAHKVDSKVSRETREALKSTSFDVWKYEESDEVGSDSSINFFSILYILQIHEYRPGRLL